MPFESNQICRNKFFFFAGGQNKNNDSESISRSRTSSWGANNHPSLAIQPKDGTASAIPAGGQPQSPSRTCSRTSSKKSNQSTLISNGKVTDGKDFQII